MRQEIFLILFFISITKICFSQAEESQAAEDTLSTPNHSKETDTDSRQMGEERSNQPGKAKDYFLKKFSLSETTDSFQIRHIPHKVVKSLQDDGAFWYANEEIKKRRAELQLEESFLDRLLNQKWFKIFVWIIIISGFTAIVIWYLILSDVNIFRKKTGFISAPDINESREDIFEIHYQDEIDKAINAGQYRLAVRLMFLRLLKNLSEKEIIEYKQGRTNFEYLMQVQSTSYYKDFFLLTRNYEYTWYGHFDLNDHAFNIIKNEFEEFDRKLN